MRTTSDRWSVLLAALCLPLAGCVDPEDSEDLEQDEDEDEDDAFGGGFVAPEDSSAPPPCPTSCPDGARCVVVDSEGNETVWTGDRRDDGTLMEADPDDADRNTGRPTRARSAVRNLVCRATPSTTLVFQLNGPKKPPGEGE